MTAWMESANCKGLDPDLFFPEPGDNAAAAKQVCAGCVVREDCFAYAVETNVRCGVWGGRAMGRPSQRSRRRRLAAS